MGRLLGLDLLGYYTMAYAIANLPVTSLCETIGRISLPVYAQIQDDRKRVKEAFQKVFESVLMILLPSTALIMLLAEDFIAVFLGDRWLPMAGVLRVLCLLVSSGVFPTSSHRCFWRSIARKSKAATRPLSCASS